MNKQVKAALSSVRGFLSGSADAGALADVEDKDARQAIAAELLAVLRRDVSEAAAEDQEQLSQKERSRQLFMELGYFDEAVDDLRAGASASERASAARALGLVGSNRATVDLVAAMFDDDEEVRNAAAEALNQVGDPSVPAVPSSSALFSKPATTVSESFEGLALADEATVGFTSSAATRNEAHAPADAIQLIVESMDTAPVLLAEDLPQLMPETKIPLSGSPVQNDESVAREEQLLLDEHAKRETIEKHERHLTAVAAARQKAENEARWRAEREARLANEAEARRVAEVQQHQRAEEEAKRRRSAEAESLATESAARQQAEAEIHRLIEEESRLRIDTGNLRQAAEDLLRQRRHLETSRRELAEAARLAEATRTRQEAEKQHQTEVKRLQDEEQALRFAVEETARHRTQLEETRQDSEDEISALKNERNRLLAVAELEIKQFKEELEELLSAEAARRGEAERQRREADERKRIEDEELQKQMEALTRAAREVSAKRSEVEAARAKAEQDSQRLTESLARMRAAEEKRAIAEKERLQVEANTNERVANEERLLEEARNRAEAEQARLNEEKRRHDEAEERRMASLEEVHRQTELEARQRAEKEKQILSEIDHLRIEDAEVRRRIEESETLKRTSEQAYRVVAEKLQRTEAEAHAASLQESQALQKLEAVRRDLAVQAQARAAQEKRLKEEIEQLHRLQDEERPRLEAATLQRTAASARLQQMKDTRIDVPPTQRHQAAGASNRVEGAALQSVDRPLVQTAAKEEGLRLVSSKSEERNFDLPSSSEASDAQLQPAVDVYLKSVDPYKRAAAVTELARTGGASAFGQIARFFDDHSPQVRNAAARALAQLEPARSVDFFNRALEESTQERRRNIGGAIAGSGMAEEAIDNLAGESREDTYNALSILFVMAKTGEVQSLERAIEEHESDEVRSAVVKLLTLSGHGELAVAATKRREARNAN